MTRNHVIAGNHERDFSGVKSLSKGFWILMFAFCTAIGAQIEIPTHPVPFTLQTLFVLLAGGLLGSRSGALSMAVYVVLGIIGLPVFSAGSFGLARILGPTGGYLLSFPIAAFLVGILVRHRTEFWWIMLSLLAGALVIFSIGTIHLHLTFIHDWIQSIQMGFLLFSWWDAVKILAAATIIHSYCRKMNVHSR